MEKKKDLFPPVSDDIIKAIRESDAVAITSHVNPDGDAVFSSLAMARILSALGKNVRLFNDDEVLDSYDIDISDSDVEWNINVNTSALHAQVSLVLVADEKERKTLVSSETVDLVSIYWLNHRNEISGNEALLRRELSLLTNRDGYILPSESVESIVQCIREEENL